jgi:signal transduction histidine kinase/ActR/RegA family two-component response regulator
VPCPRPSSEERDASTRSDCDPVATALQLKLDELAAENAELRRARDRAESMLRRLLDASVRIVGETALDRLLQLVSDAALELTRARVATFGHGYVNGHFLASGSSRVEGAPECPRTERFAMQRGGVYMDLVEGRETIRLTDAEMRAHPRWWGLPDDHVPMRGILGVRLDDAQGRISGMILVTDRLEGDFTAQDEALLRQLGAIASLAVQHVQARLGLEEADRRKDEFLAVLSHELRNPLAPIRNGLYVLGKAGPESDQGARALEVIERQVGHMTRLVDDLLDVTRVSRGKIQLQVDEVDLGEIVRRAVEDHRSAFVENGVGLEAAIPEAPLVVDGDAIRLSQVMGNLLQNAAKFTGRGGRTEVRVATEGGGDAVGVAVADTGVGVSRDMLARLFEPFAQADSTLDRTRGGLGLGLALVKSIVELHGGRVTARSDGPGTGAEFGFSLPLRAEPRDRAAPPVARAEAGTRRVLIVEDNEDAAETLREVLELAHHEVAVAHDGASALELARRFRPDVVLCDIGLPSTDGYAVARAFRADAELRSAHLVALTGYATPDDHARARDAGFDQHVAKPAPIEAIERILAGAPARTRPCSEG